MTPRSKQIPLTQYLGQWEKQPVCAVYHDHGQRRIVIGLLHVNADGKSIVVEIQKTNEQRQLYFHGAIKVESLTAGTMNVPIYPTTTFSNILSADDAEFAPLSTQEHVVRSLMILNLFLALGVLAQSGSAAPTVLMKLYTVGIALIIASPTLLWIKKHHTSRLLR